MFSLTDTSNFFRAFDFNAELRPGLSRAVNVHLWKQERKSFRISWNLGWNVCLGKNEYNWLA